jgi:acetyl esterase/lipase
MLLARSILLTALAAAVSVLLAAADGLPTEASTRVTTHFDISYNAPGLPETLLDVYEPTAGGSGSLPVVMYIHGGGWRGGDKRTAQPLLTRLADAGYVVVSIDYRLAPEHSYPAQVEDCTAALEWIHEHISSYGGDRSRIAVAGHSAGGHLAALLGVGRGGVSMVEDSFAVQAVLVWAAPVDFLKRTPATNPSSMVSQFFGGRPEKIPDIARKASPLTYIDAGDPPFMISHGTSDTSVPVGQSRMLTEALSAAGVAVEYHEVLRGLHDDLFTSGKKQDRELGWALAFLDARLKSAGASD